MYRFDVLHSTVPIRLLLLSESRSVKEARLALPLFRFVTCDHALIHLPGSMQLLLQSSNDCNQFISWLDANGDERLWGIDIDTALTGAMIRLPFFCHCG